MARSSGSRQVRDTTVLRGSAIFGRASAVATVPPPSLVRSRVWVWPPFGARSARTPARTSTRASGHPGVLNPSVR
ncbi:hypothetical protein ACFWOL_23190 [Streptomyces sp. NPDC058442]|uniref:hypothetical protein n=1 Tax=Streptomyces sp. NPDC058442 TaxID=3346503 RepID=UPI0036606603